jgi:flagellar biosynthesis protein FlhF
MVADKTQNLYVKSFFASSIREAIERASQELGPDALLLNTREAPPEARHLGAFEVVFGGLPEEVAAPPEREVAAAPAVAPVLAPAPSGGDDVRANLREIRELLVRLSPAPSGSRRSESVVERMLIEAEIPPALAREIDDAVRQRANRAVVEIARPRTETLLTDTLAELDSRIAVNPEIGRITALVGTPGCGKTTTLVKLAFTEGIGKGRAVRLISADSVRVGAADQLRTYAAILGVPFQAVESTAALAQAIDSAPAQTLVLIDTPGCSAALLEDPANELAAYIAGRQDIDTHLVLTANTRLADMRNAAERYSVFRPSKLLFTRLDEASSYAAMYCEAAREGKEISFLAAGQSIPEDLEAATKSRITQALVQKLPETLAAVA